MRIWHVTLGIMAILYIGFAALIAFPDFEPTPGMELPAPESVAPKSAGPYGALGPVAESQSGDAVMRRVPLSARDLPPAKGPSYNWTLMGLSGIVIVLAAMILVMVVRRSLRRPTA